MRAKANAIIGSAAAVLLILNFMRAVSSGPRVLDSRRLGPPMMRGVLDDGAERFKFRCTCVKHKEWWASL
eukprot:3772287-Pyramimonas_sp.AAC.1